MKPFLVWRLRSFRVAVLSAALLLALTELFAWPALYGRYFAGRGGRRYVFVDGGAYRGETIRHFYRSAGCSLLPWEVFAFEPDPALGPRLKAIPSVVVIEQAITGHEGSVEFFLNPVKAGNTIVPELASSLAQRVQVPALNFSRWLRESFTRKDYVWVKLDIEGAEFEVLSQLLADGTAGLIDVLYIEMHAADIGIDVQNETALLNAMRLAGVEVWDGDTVDAIPGDWFRPRLCLPWTFCSFGFCKGEPAQWFQPELIHGGKN